MNNGDMPASAPNAGWRDNDPKAAGLTKREAFAMAAMQSCWWELTDRGQPQHMARAAQLSRMMADALLAELEATNDR